MVVSIATLIRCQAAVQMIAGMSRDEGASPVPS
jgi:hypothetical protein